MLHNTQQAIDLSTSRMSTNRPIIALDADGVLLDYTRAYAHAWERAFGYFPKLRDPNAYWPMEHWQVEQLDADGYALFRQCFDEQFWSTIPAVPGAVEACHKLAEAGYDLVCVTAMEAQYSSARTRNLKSLGFPIETVVATGNSTGARSPKADAIAELKPVAFVDDFLPYHAGIAAGVHRALILRAPNGSPNTGPDSANVHSQHLNLAEFSQWWLAR